MININIEEETLINMLIERLRFFTDDPEVIDLFQKMYENEIELFSNIEDFNVKVIVDNDYVNNYTVYYKDNPHYKEIKKLYKKNGLCDISCEGLGYSAIVAVSDDEKIFLLRNN